MLQAQALPSISETLELHCVAPFGSNKAIVEIKVAKSYGMIMDGTNDLEWALQLKTCRRKKTREKMSPSKMAALQKIHVRWRDST